MEAARVAAMRGHSVTLYESSHRLGGLLPMAALVKGTEIEPLPKIVRYLKSQIEKLGVNIKLGKKVDFSTVEKINPDAVILATGGLPTVPDIPGIDNRKVIKSGELHKKLKIYLRFLGPVLLRWLTKFWLPVGKRVIIIGGEIQGCELAEFLVKRGRKVTIVDSGENPGAGMIMHLRQQLLMWFEQKGVRVMTGVRYVEINDKGLALVNKEGEQQTVEADTIIMALPLTPDVELLEKLKEIVPEIYAVGDCREPGLIVDAIRDGLQTGHNI